jgi:hypothetical protein
MPNLMNWKETWKNCSIKCIPAADRYFYSGKTASRNFSVRLEVTQWEVAKIGDTE